MFRNLEKHLGPSQTSAETPADWARSVGVSAPHWSSVAGDEEAPVRLNEKDYGCLRQPLGGGDRPLLRRITSNATTAATAATATPT